MVVDTAVGVEVVKVVAAAAVMVAEAASVAMVVAVDAATAAGRAEGRVAAVALAGCHMEKRAGRLAWVSWAVAGGADLPDGASAGLRCSASPAVLPLDRVSGRQRSER